MKQIALSVEKMKHLEELGLDTSDASMFWYAHTVKYPSRKQSDFSLCVIGLCKYNWDEDRCIFTYTLQDILEKLPSTQLTTTPKNSPTVDTLAGGFHREIGKTLLEAAYNMLLWCIENNYIKTK